jgi:formylglycine-generating enzyme
MRGARWATILVVAASLACRGETVGVSSTDATAEGSSETADAYVEWPDGSTIDSGTCGLHPGPRMVRIDVTGDAGKGSFCIDTTEVTNAHYDDFLVSSVRPKLPSFCGALDYGAAVTTLALQQFPRTNVPWCAAFAYCAWAGKRLCGKLGGGHTDFLDFKFPAASQWSYACRQGPANTGWPYGATYDIARCNGDGATFSEVKSKAACHGETPPFNEIFDMAGNAGEWEDSCDGYDSPSPRRCHIRGGWAGNTDSNCDDPTDAEASFAESELSFRCCVDL